MSEREQWKVNTERRWLFYLADSTGAAKTGQAGTCASKLMADTGTGFANSAVAVTISEVDSVNDPGWYQARFTPNVNNSDWVNAVTHPTYSVFPWKDEIHTQSHLFSDLALDSSGRPGVDWSNVGAPTTAVALTGTTVATSQAVASVTGSVGSVTGSVAGDVQGKVLGGGASSIAGIGAQADVRQWLGGVVNALVAGRVDASVGAVVAGALAAASFAANALGAVWDEIVSAHTTAGTLGELLGSGVTVATNNDKTGYSLTAGEHTSIATAIGTRDIALDEASAPQHSLDGAIQKLTCAVDASSGTSLVVKRTDGSTAYTQPLTTDGNANPIVAAG